MEIARISVTETSGVCTMWKRIPVGIAGATVTISYDSPVWETLTKTVVFRGCCTKTAHCEGNVATIPYEVVQEAGIPLFFGVWGHNADTGLQIPLIEVPIATIEAATDVTADPGTDPTLPIWAELENRIDLLEQSGGGSGGGTAFETDETLHLENGILSVNTTDRMEQDNTLPITSAGVYTTVGNIEALLKTI